MTEAVTPCTNAQVECVEEVFQRIASDLSMIADRELTVDSIETVLMDTRPEGRGKIHISFRLGFQAGTGIEHGCLLVPLPDAISLACCLMMVPGDVVKSNRSQKTLDSTTKDAMLEVGNFICGATDSALRALGIDDTKVSFEGCQGVKSNVRPALIYREGDPLVVGRANVAMAEFPEDTMVLVVPANALGGLKGN
jgi:hypothetical protein